MREGGTRRVAGLVLALLVPLACGGGPAADGGLPLVERGTLASPHARPGIFGFCGSATAMTGGLGVGHLDDDGHLDLVIPRLALAPVVAYGNGDLSFTQEVLPMDDPSDFYGAGVAIADFDGDGLVDIAIASVGDDAAAVWLQGADGFDPAQRLGNDGACSTNLTVVATDLDDDDAIDLAITDWRGRDQPSAGTIVHLGDGSGGFTPAGPGATSEGLLGHHDRSLMGLALVDFDRDGTTDVFASADWNRSAYQRDALGGGPVEDALLTDSNGMGLAVSDLDLDGHLDVFVSSIGSVPDRSCNDGSGSACSGNRIYEIAGSGSSVERTDAYGARHTGWGWGATFADLDHDGTDELLVANGMQIPGETLQPLMGSGELTEPTGLWVVHPDAGTQETVGDTADLAGKAVAAADLDRDGDLDLVHVATNAGALLLENTFDPSPDQWVGLEVPATAWPSGVDALQVWLETDGGRSPIRTIQRGGWFQLSAPETAHFGLGSSDPWHSTGPLRAVVFEVGTGTARCIPIPTTGAWIEIAVTHAPRCE